jgi:hypothetical protein
MTGLLQWTSRVYYAIPSSLRLAGLGLERFGRNLVRRVPLTLLQTTDGSNGQGASLIVAGGTWAQYLPTALTEGPFEYTKLGSVPLWHLPRTLRARAPSATLIIARVDRIAAQLLFGPDYLRVPDTVDLRLDIPEDLGSLYRGKDNSTLRNDLNRAQRNGLTCEISHCEADLIDFYHRFHVPFVRERFGRFASPHNLTFLRGHFPQGGLIWVMHNGKRVAGSVFGQPDRVPTALALGTLNGDYAVVELGVNTVIFRTLIEHAHHLGRREINFGGSRPLLIDGSLRFKKKWGMRIAKRERSQMLLVHWQRLVHYLADMLTHSGLIFEHQGQLSAISVLDCTGRAAVDDVTRAYHFLRMPGLRRLYLCSRSGFEPDIDVPPHTCLIDLGSPQPVDLLGILTSAQDVGPCT